MNTPVFADSEQMRMLLYDLTYSPGGGWRTDPRATDLMRFAMDKYAGLARKYGLEPGEAAVAAFEVMRMRSTRLADDPWAVITRAVELTLICCIPQRAQQLRKAVGVQTEWGSPKQVLATASLPCVAAPRICQRRKTMGQGPPIAGASGRTSSGGACQPAPCACKARMNESATRAARRLRRSAVGGRRQA